MPGCPAPPPHYLPRPTTPSDTQCRPCNAVHRHTWAACGSPWPGFALAPTCMWASLAESDQSCQPSVVAAGRRRHAPRSRVDQRCRRVLSIREPGRVASATHSRSTHHTAAALAHPSPTGDALMTHSATSFWYPLSTWMPRPSCLCPLFCEHTQPPSPSRRDYDLYWGSKPFWLMERASDALFLSYTLRGNVYMNG